MPRVFHFADFFQQPLHHIALVVNRKLHRDAGKILEKNRRSGENVLLMLHVSPDHLVTMTAVHGKNQQQQEIGNQQRKVEPLQMMHAGESIVKKRMYELIRRTSYDHGRSPNEPKTLNRFAVLQFVLNILAHLIHSSLDCTFTYT